MTFRLVFTVRDPPRTPRTMVTNIAGCVDAEDAKVKLRQYYPEQVVKIKSVEEAK